MTQAKTGLADKPVVISCGEPSGIGPEVAARAWAMLSGEVPLAWIGDPRHLPRDIPHCIIDSPSDALAAGSDALPVLRHDFAAGAVAGQPNPANARGVIDAIARGVDLVRSGAAFAYPGHTEYLAALAGGSDVVMMLASDQLRVVPATIHIALDQVPNVLTPAHLRRVIEITAAGLRSQFGIKAPRIAIAGLNPHAGEGGTMGRQEADWMTALVTRMKGEGYDLCLLYTSDAADE